MNKVVLALAMAGAVTAELALPTSYTAKVTMTMPYYDLVEPIQAWMDADAGLGRLDYWGGVDTYIYNSSGTCYQIVPTTSDGMHSDETCFMSGDKMEAPSMFPDVTYFPSEPDMYEATSPCVWRGKACESYTLKSPTYDETTGFDGNYTLYMDVETGLPLAFHFTGFNVILGSHYDEYIFDYLEIDTSAPEPSIFNAPTTSMECVVLETDDGDDGGPTKTDGGAALRPHVPSLETPLSDIAAMLPGGGSKRAERFESWAAKHGKAFEAEEEKFHRASLYHATEKYVNAMNRKRLPYWLEANHMADWTAEEKKALRGRMHTPKGTVVEATFEHEPSATDLPDNVDWVAAGAVTPPKDQGSCGSCWSYGATGTTEGQLFLKTGKLTPLSQQNLMDCSWPEGNHACDGGLDFRGYRWMLAHGGLATEATYPYLNSDGFCRFSSSEVGATITGYANLSGTVDDLNDALATVGPISVSVDAAADSFYYYAGGLYTDTETCKSGMDDLDHTVLAVGYTTVDGQKYTTVKNSWSDHWGDKGFIHVTQKDNCCGVATQPTYVTLA